jgi:hypothetical protein
MFSVHSQTMLFKGVLIEIQSHCVTVMGVHAEFEKVMCLLETGNVKLSSALNQKVAENIV